jgi:branched-chain amino acid aminotransferase
MSSKFVLINEKIIPATEASVYINDLSIQRGYGIFDFFKLVDGRPIFLDDHLARFYNSAAQMRLPINHSPEELKDLLSSLIAKNELPDSGVRMTLTGGYSTDGFSISEPNLIITQQKFHINKEAALTGTRLVTYSHQRQFPEVKTIDYLMAIWLKNYIVENHADDVLYQHEGNIRECPRANVFIFTHENKLLTPGKNILKGIIRKQVLNLAKASFTVEETDITLKDLYNAKEVFITSSTKNILPVIQIDGHFVGDGKPGDNTRFLQEKLIQAIYQLCV